MSSGDGYKTKKNELFKKLDVALRNNDTSEVRNVQNELSKLGISGSLKSASKVKKDKK